MLCPMWRAPSNQLKAWIDQKADPPISKREFSCLVAFKLAHHLFLFYSSFWPSNSNWDIS